MIGTMCVCVWISGGRLRRHQQVVGIGVLHIASVQLTDSAVYVCNTAVSATSNDDDDDDLSQSAHMNLTVIGLYISLCCDKLLLIQ